jgi:hypothetical protein
MPKRLRNASIVASCLVGLLGSGAPASEPAEKLSFERHVRPILKEYCFECHGAGARLKGGLDLRLKRFLVQGGDNGPAIVPGDAAKSPLLRRLRAGEMPPGEKKVPAAKIAVIEQWLAQGAVALRPEPEKLPPGHDITPEERAYWFYQPLGRPEAPRFTAADRVRTPIDAFVLGKLRSKGLAFNPDAEPLTLLRRASLDLTGLPPTPQEIDAFLSDASVDAYDKALDRMLASPHYGERWARHWLDVAGYADSDGDGSNDTPRPHSWRFRDYVVRAFQADKPLDQFIIEQLAGDELVPLPWTNLKPDQIDILAATGFLRTAPDATSSGGGAEQANQVAADTLKIVGSALLGLTVGCAQCHDHRYDPISHVDYFRFRAIFEPALDPARWRRPGQRLVSLYTDADRAKAAAVEAEAQKMQADYNAKQQQHLFAALEKVLTKYPEAERDQLRAAYHAPAAKRTDAQKKLLALNPSINISPGVLYQYDQKAADELKKLQAVINAKRATKPVEQFVAVLNEIPGQISPTRLFHRGDYRQPKHEVQPGDLTIAAPEASRYDIPPDDDKLPTSGRRLAYARHLTSGSHPLFGRVLANRIWFHHFGRGIVDTPGDFGILGQRPTHPELLDWLATELPRQGWSLKALHKLIMTSTTYRQSAQRSAAQDAVDSDNALYARYPLRRLEAEAIRDRILATTGRLDRTLFGPPVPTVEDAVGQVIVPDDKPRRSIYVQARRSKPAAFLATFDAPAGELNCDRRTPSTSAPQSLMLMNSDFLLQQAGHFARRLRAETPRDVERARLVAHAWQMAYQRPADAEELDLACRFLDRQITHYRAAKHADAELAALTNLCQQLLSSNEFLYVD